MKKSIPNGEDIRKGIIGYSMGGVNYKAFISVIRGKHYIGYEAQKEMKSLERGESLKPGQLLEIRERKNLKEASVDAMNYRL